MNELLKKDISIKIVSVVLAILLWIYVLNVENPYDTKTLSVKLNIENVESLEDKGLVLKNENFENSIDITVRGRKEVIDSVRPSDFFAVLDFSNVKTEKDNRIRIEGPYYDIRDISIVSVSPRTIEVQLEKVVEATFPVEAIVNSKLKENYRVLNVTHSPDSFKFRDVESLVSSIGSVKLVVDINNVNEGLTVNKELKVYNKNGDEIPSLSRNLNVDVSVELAKEVTVELVLKGSPAQDYIEVSRDMNPKRVLISGQYSLLEGVNRLETEVIDISGATEDVNVNSLISLPEGVWLVNSPKEVSVSIDVDRIVKKEFTVSKENISLRNTDSNNIYNYDIVSPTVTFEVKGREQVLHNLDLENIRPYVNVDGLDEGTHVLPLAVQVPYGVEMVQNIDIQVRVGRTQIEP
ncbi:MAG: YbbR-like domain-containing protein [Acetivibrionales bacterium]|jgi:YbbR domain-containing protein